MMGLDLTRQALCYPSIVERMGKIGGNASKLFVDLMGFFCKTQKQVFGWEGGPLHDPTCIAYLIDESCIETKDMYSEVEIRSEKCYGRTLCDYFGVTKNKPNSKVSINIYSSCQKIFCIKSLPIYRKFRSYMRNYHLLLCFAFYNVQISIKAVNNH